jgi:hypothetical protein
MEKRFTALRILGTIYKILGIIVGLLTVLGLIAICAGGALGAGSLRTLSRAQGLGLPLGGVLGTSLGSGAALAGMGAVLLVYGLVAALTLYALGEGIYLLLAVEENTRATVIWLSRGGQAGQSPTPPAGQS